MADRTKDGLRACVASLRTIVSPAVETSGDKLAREQVGLVAKYLEFVIQRLDHAESRSSFELRQYRDMGENVAETLRVAGISDDGLKAALDSARKVEGRGSTKRELEDATAALQSALSRIVRALGEQRHPLERQVSRAILDGSRAVVTMQRAWFAPQGWEFTPPDIEQLLSENRASG